MEAIRGQVIESGTVMDEETYCDIYEALDYGSPREAQARLGNFAISQELRCDYTVKQHIYVATESPERSLEKRHAKVRQSKYGSSEGLDAWDLEMAYLLLDLDKVME